MKAEPSLATLPKAPRLRVGLKDVDAIEFKQAANEQLEAILRRVIHDEIGSHLAH